jgi:hypothetical protein
MLIENKNLMLEDKQLSEERQGLIEKEYEKQEREIKRLEEQLNAKYSETELLMRELEKTNSDFARAMLQLKHLQEEKEQERQPLQTSHAHNLPLQSHHYPLQNTSQTLVEYYP